jgi:hypothetical protein
MVRILEKLIVEVSVIFIKQPYKLKQFPLVAQGT